MQVAAVEGADWMDFVPLGIGRIELKQPLTIQSQKRVHHQAPRTINHDPWPRPSISFPSQ